jgi:outer membrane receptor protein involved in Fe transport
VPAHGLAEPRIDWTHVFSHNVTAGLFVDNLFDEVYYRNGILTANSLGSYDGGRRPPRMAGLRIRFDWGPSE